MIGCYVHPSVSILFLGRLLINVSIFARWLGSRVVIVLDSGTEGLGSNRSRYAVG